MKTRLVRLGGKGFGGARAHLRYIQRGGVAHEGAPGQLYSDELDAADGKDFLERCAGDRHQFRLIVSAEDGAQYDDLRPLIRRFMKRMEEGSGTQLDWVAVDHRDTGHPHTHIMLRGKDEAGENLVIAREYISRGMRERVAELVTLDLGPRTELEIAERARLEVGAERLTGMDRQLVREAGTEGFVVAGVGDPYRHALRSGRLRKLGALGLAEEIGSGLWRLPDDLEERLRRIGERGDIIRTMQRELTARGVARAAAEQNIFDASSSAPLVGRLVARGLEDELADRHYLIVDGLDGRSHYVSVGKGEALEPLPEGGVVEIVPARGGVRAVDRVVAEIAALNETVYDATVHRAHDPGASHDFIEAHGRRLEALRRGGAGPERLDDGSWRILADHLERVAAYEKRRARDGPVEVRLLSTVSIEAQVSAEASTWLDGELSSDAPRPLREAGFGREVRAALAARRQWLIDMGLAESPGEGMAYPSDLAATLRRRELLRVASGLAEELGLPFVERGEGERVAGVLRRRLDLVSGRFALVESGRDFSLVPWRPVLARHVGREVVGRVRGEGISWSIGRGRSGPEIG